MLVYIIQSDDEIYYVTTSKEKAKQLIKGTLADNIEYPEEEAERIETFAQDLVDGNTEEHYSDEFEGICIWCEIHNLIE